MSISRNLISSNSRLFKSVAKKLGFSAENRALQEGSEALQKVIRREHLALSPEAVKQAAARGVVPTGLPDEKVLTSALEQLTTERRHHVMQKTAEQVSEATVVKIQGQGPNGRILRSFGVGQGQASAMAPEPNLKSQVSIAGLQDAKARLTPESHPASAALPEDGTLRPTTYYMHLGDRPSPAYIEQMRTIGGKEGFNVVAVGSPREMQDLGALQGRVKAVEHPGGSSVWIEDFMTYTESGDVIVPPKILSDAPFRAPATAHAELGIPKGVIGQQGAVSLHGASDAGIALGTAGDRKVFQASTYVEDGNFIPGTLADGTPYAIVGKDSLRISREHLREALKAPHLTDADTLAIMAKDYGIKPENLFAIEQPAEFHLDMRMLAVGPKEIVLNDSMAAAEKQAQWWIDDYTRAQPKAPPRGATKAEREAYQRDFSKWMSKSGELDDAIARLKKNAADASKVEALTVADLEHQGFKVHRIPGVFERHWQYDPATAWMNTPENAKNYTGMMNFFNGEQAVDDAGKKYFITLGGDQRAEDYFFERVLRETSVAYDRIYFMARNLTDQTLELAGGINCRVKPEGRRAIEFLSPPKP